MDFSVRVTLSLVILFATLHSTLQEICYPGYVENMPEISEQDLDEAFKFAEDFIEERRKLERQLKQQGKFLDSTIHSAETRNQMGPPPEIVMEHQENAQRFIRASMYLTKKFNLTKEQATCGLPYIRLSGRGALAAVEECYRLHTLQCQNFQNSKYRTLDGSCNNLGFPSWGQSLKPHDRLLAPDYADGIFKRRMSVTGKELPPARVVSNMIHADRDVPSEITNTLWVWGQILSHDITSSPAWVPVSGEKISCCPELTHPLCSPSEIPKDDPFYAKIGKQCMNLVRRAPSPPVECTLGPRHPMNMINTYIDASPIYGLDQQESAGLRTFAGDGLLKTEFVPGVGEVLPPSDDVQLDQCSIPKQNLTCFKSGDIRVNQHTSLAMVHMLWARQHNRLARKLKQINPHWDEERLFEETRRIVGAQVQAIVYREFLPAVLGPDYMSLYSLRICGRVGCTNYDPKMNPTIWMEFSGAAFRFAHSSILGLLGNPEIGLLESQEALRDSFMVPFGLREDRLERQIHRTVNYSAQTIDLPMSDDVRNFMHAVKGSGFGMDLATINIHRARDNGIPAYHHFLKLYFGTEVEEFEDLRNFMSDDKINKLKEVYSSVKDIDLWTGGLAEYHVPGGIVGPTFAHIIGAQFKKLKFGDRYFFTHRYQASSFTPRQQASICRTTISKIFCENGNVTYIQLNGFYVPSETNPVVDCADIPDVNLKYWKE